MPRLAEHLEIIFSDIMTQETVPVRERTRVNCSHWDSLIQLGLISAIEQEFNIELSESDVLDLNSFEAAEAIISEKLARKR